MNMDDTMEGPRSFQVAGADGCRAGWVVALLRATRKNGAGLRYPLDIEALWLSPHFADVLLKTYNCKLVCVDIPLGLSDGPQPRACDVAARRLLGRRGASIFTPPTRACLPAPSYRDASEAHFQCTGKRLSKQSFLIMDKIQQVDELVTPAMQKRVREIHPEVIFHVLNENRPAEHSKKTVAGRAERVALLSGIFPTAAEAANQARRAHAVAPDDILDALAAGWAAAQAVIGQAATLPEQPEYDSKGLRMEILLPLARSW
jgi:predicted RNase H-like nuclease